MLETKMNKQCISCGNVFSGDEIQEHKEDNSCPSIDMVITGPMS